MYFNSGTKTVVKSSLVSLTECTPLLLLLCVIWAGVAWNLIKWSIFPSVLYHCPTMENVISAYKNVK